MPQQLSQKDITTLREKGLLNESETAYKEGDVVVVENLLTHERRILNVVGLLLDVSKKILHD